MGRAKLNMEFITKEKTRNTTFAKRKKGLIRKLDELTILCDVSACIIIYGPKNETGLSEPDVWPTDRDRAHRIIQSYRAKNNDSSSSSKTYGLPDFWLDRLKKVEDELAKQRKKNMEARYPTWLDFMDYMPESGLRDFAAALSRKAEDVRSRIECMRGAKQGLIDFGCYYTGPNQFQEFGLGQANGLGLGLVQYPNVESKALFEDNGPSFYGPGKVGPFLLPALPSQPVEMQANGFGQEGFDAWCQMSYGSRGSYYE
ncbi:MADS-box transcription factor family protein [Striga hermonthica]|uniref:MADS-box transcription factor family protein n=1 Tax=Striga hermonthica TaxID=68872 RepID=A0A9N7QZU4_STRHE|nr:MADS-box transcription factor family protein [Striga hermonthica]